MAVKTQNIVYEPHIHEDPEFPIIFHMDEVINRKGDSTYVMPHCHEGVEILWVQSGRIEVFCDSKRITASAGEFVVISSERIHEVYAFTETARYYCLIVDKSMCVSFGIFLEKITFRSLISDKEAERKFKVICREIEGKRLFYKAAAKTASLDFIIHLCRKHVLSEESEGVQAVNLEPVKIAMRYIQENYGENISTADIARKVGLSKSYFCRLFKKHTRYTVVSYINLIRCASAKRLFGTGRYLVSEVALLSGFDNSSYFSRTYKKYMGKLPSQTQTRD